MPQAHGVLSLELTMPQFKTLALLDAEGSATGGRLARALGVGLSTVPGIVARLCEAGLVSRGEDPDDRRATRVRLTAAGEATMERFHRIRAEALTRLLDRLSLAELELAVRATTLLAEAAQAVADESTQADRTPLQGGPV
jgi:DNA-binding MarR family transcriptional regulator